MGCFSQESNETELGGCITGTRHSLWLAYGVRMGLKERQKKKDDLGLCISVLWLL